MKLNEYRLNSLEEPSDELLRQLMEQVAISFRESSHRVENERDAGYAKWPKIKKRRKSQQPVSKL